MPDQANTNIPPTAQASKETKPSNELPILATSLLGAALLALGIGFATPTGEQSKLHYTGDLWCVSNFIEERPYRKLPDGRAAKDPRLIGKEDWIVREQVAAKSKEDAETQATKKGLFESSDADTLRGALDRNDQDFFTKHFNTGATVAGPCMGTGDVSKQTGKWLNEIIREKCFGLATSGDKSDLYNPDAFSADQINQFLAKKYPKSPLQNMGQVFVDAGKNSKVNPAFLLGMANAETSLGSGSSVGNYNLFNIGGTTSPRNYGNFADAIKDGAKLAGSSSYSGLKDIREIRLKWCGYENESESSGIKISDGSVIDYVCANGNSKWEDEVKAIMDQLKAMFPQTTSPSTGTKPQKIAGAPEGCPDTPPEAGPSSGEDLREIIAKSFAEQLSARGVNQACVADVESGKKIVEAAMKYAPNADGTTKYKYDDSHSASNSLMDCSEFSKTVLEQAKALGANVAAPSSSNAYEQSSQGKLIHSIDVNKFKIPGKGTKLRTASDLPPLANLQVGDLIFFGTSTTSPEGGYAKDDSAIMYDSISVGHVGIYIGDGKYIHSTSSDKNPDRDSASPANRFTDPPISAHTQGANYAAYNGVKIDSLTDSYFSPQFYIMTRRFTLDAANCPTYTGVYGKAEGLGTTANPGGTSASPSFGDCHGTTLCNPGGKSHHNSINGSINGYQQGDAIDIGTNGYAYAAFDGTASEHYGGDRADLVGVRLKSTNGQVVADYYHVTPVKTGQVKAGDIIGKLYPLRGSDHIHFELAVNGQTVHGNTSLRGDQSAYAKSLWANMKKVLGL